MDGLLYKGNMNSLGEHLRCVLNVLVSEVVTVTELSKHMDNTTMGFPENVATESPLRNRNGWLYEDGMHIHGELRK